MANAMASVLAPGVLGVAELSSARLDGELYCVDERFAPVDEVDATPLRATALRGEAGPRLIAELQSALWVHGVRAFPPVVHTMCVARSERLKFSPGPRFVVREMTHAPGDVAELAGLRVTVPARILYDLAFAPGTVVDRDALELLARWPQLSRECAERIAGVRNLPGKTAALQRLEKWAVHSTAHHPALTR